MTRTIVASATREIIIGFDQPFCVIGERINPTGRKKLAAEMVAGNFETVIKRLEGAQDQKKEGKQLCIDIINEVKEIPGISGVHVMAYRQEEYVAEIVDESGVLKGRQPWKREIRRDDQMVADRLDHILHDEITETQVDMVKTAH